MFSVTGEHDHSSFAGGGAQLVWGLKPDGSLANISDVERGRGCCCVCPACQLPLVARKGPKLAAHFAHEGGSACAGVRETNAHAWAKQILDQQKKLWLPAGYAVAGDWERRTFEARVFKFESARLERRVGDIVPDVILSANGRELIVEILVTHACDEEKIEKIRKGGISALEIDLSAHRHSESEDVVAEALIGGPRGGAPREWLYNAKVAEHSEQLEAERVKKIAERQAHAEAERKNRVVTLVRAARTIRIVSTDDTLADLQTVGQYGLLDHVGIVRPNSRCAFRVPAKLWQASALTRVLIPASREWGTTFGVREILRDLEGCIAPAFREEPMKILQQEVCRALPGFRFPREAIAEYLFDLMQRGIVEPEARGAYRLTDDMSHGLRQCTEALVARRKRDEAAGDRLRRILNHIPDDEQQDFSLEKWLRRPMPQVGLSLAEIIESGDGWAAIESFLAGIERMFRPGQPPAEITLGLPIDAAIQRVADRERAAAEKLQRDRAEAEDRAAKDRVSWLTRQATEMLHGNARQWLDHISPEGISHRALAESSDRGFRRAETLLAAAQVQLQKDRASALLRAQLTKAAAAALGTEKADLFIRAHHPRLGMSPWERCADQVGLRICLELLQKRSR